MALSTAPLTAPRGLPSCSWPKSGPRWHGVTHPGRTRRCSSVRLPSAVCCRRLAARLTTGPTPLGPHLASPHLIRHTGPYRTVPYRAVPGPRRNPREDHHQPRAAQVPPSEQELKGLRRGRLEAALVQRAAPGPRLRRDQGTWIASLATAIYCSCLEPLVNTPSGRLPLSPAACRHLPPSNTIYHHRSSSATIRHRLQSA